MDEVKPKSNKELVLELKTARESESMAKAKMTERLEWFKANDIEYVAADGSYKIAKKTVDELTSEIKASALAVYQYSKMEGNPKNTKPFTGVIIKIFKKYVINDRQAVLEWAKLNYPAALTIAHELMGQVIKLLIEHLPAALAVNDDMIIDYVKNVNPVPGVTVLDDPRAEIASKL